MIYSAETLGCEHKCSNVATTEQLFSGNGKYLHMLLVTQVDLKDSTFYQTPLLDCSDWPQLGHFAHDAQAAQSVVTYLIHLFDI